MDEYFNSPRNYNRRLPYGHYNTFSVIDAQDPDRLRFAEVFAQMKAKADYRAELFGLDQETSRAVAVLVGLGVADAFGASTEFRPFLKTREELFDSFAKIKQLIRSGVLDTRSGRVGVWTDDASMALSMADSLLLKGFKFDPSHIRYMFIMWLEHGLDNGGRPYSIGLGGNISISMKEFMHRQQDYAEEGDKFNNGNGSLMRLAPMPVAFRANEEEAMEYSGLSSKTTHNGEEASECCRLLALILVRLIRRGDADWKDTLNTACAEFRSCNRSVEALARSQPESQEVYDDLVAKYGSKFRKFNKLLKDRDWNWKSSEHTYADTRLRQQPGYIGSYCMDALAMALHINWHRDSFFKVVRWGANMCGDCDTVGAIAAQIAGAIYGVDDRILALYAEMDDVKTSRYELFLKAYKIAAHKSI